MCNRVRGRGGCGLLGRGLCRCRRRDRQDCRRAVERCRRHRQGASSHGHRDQEADRGQTVDQLLLAGPEWRSDAGGGRQGRVGHRDGHGAAHQPGTEDGCAVVDGQYRRLPRRDRSRQQLWPFLHRSGDGCRQGAPGQGSGRRCRCGGSCRHRHIDSPWRNHLCVRRAPRSGRAG